MIGRILRLAVQGRWFVVMITAAIAAFGLWHLSRLPIDAVPDITNKQVQINSSAPALSPAEMERRVTFPIENGLAGIPGLQSTRSISRNGFSQVTAIFDENVDLYFARQQVAERLGQAKESASGFGAGRVGSMRKAQGRRPSPPCARVRWKARSRTAAGSGRSAGSRAVMAMTRSVIASASGSPSSARSSSAVKS